jgi:hypothetical protein
LGIGGEGVHGVVRLVDSVIVAWCRGAVNFPGFDPVASMGLAAASITCG